jgi:hypothetical protein
MNQNEIVHIDHIRDFLSFVQICHCAFLHINKDQTIARIVGIGNLGSCVLTNIKILKPKTSHKIDTKSMLCMRARDNGQLERLAKGKK